MPKVTAIRKVDDITHFFNFCVTPSTFLTEATLIGWRRSKGVALLVWHSSGDFYGPADCAFEQDMCNYLNQHHGDNFDWSRYNTFTTHTPTHTHTHPHTPTHTHTQTYLIDIIVLMIGFTATYLNQWMPYMPYYLTWYVEVLSPKDWILTPVTPGYKALLQAGTQGPVLTTPTTIHSDTLPTLRQAIQEFRLIKPF